MKHIVSRTATCEICKKSWIISSYAIIYSMGYECPICWDKRKRREREKAIKASKQAIVV